MIRSVISNRPHCQVFYQYNGNEKCFHPVIEIEQRGRGRPRKIEKEREKEIKTETEEEKVHYNS